ncbi:MAG TPA: sulfite exporter TauE/SafE family protein, partial [Sulfuricurvum sp.]|nr:sulfite exporter TauE/SafE family protein [Sulfuricurvum sp.]
MVELIFLGMGVGALSGFFGIGGGTILVPALLFIGYDMKMAVGISVLQMVFSSIYGSYLNLKKGTLDIKMVLMIGLGGFAGALTSNLIVSALSSTTLEWIFLGFVLFAMARMFMHTANHGETEVKSAHPVILFAIG